MDIVDEVLSNRDVRQQLGAAFAPHRDDLQRLVSILDLALPTAILEFGSGWSTLVMARWLMDHPGSFMEALEADPMHYVDTLYALGAMPGVERFVGGENKVRQVRRDEWEPIERWRVLFSPSVNGQQPNGVLFAYQCLSEPDFVYLDGPALWGRRIITENAFTHVNIKRPMIFLVDGRVGCASVLYQVYNTQLRQPYSWLYSASSSCSLVYHEKYAHVGEWFAETHEHQRAEEST